MEARSSTVHEVLFYPQSRGHSSAKYPIDAAPGFGSCWGNRAQKLLPSCYQLGSTPAFSAWTRCKQGPEGIVPLDKIKSVGVRPELTRARHMNRVGP